jgi:hypothetical protein
MNADRCGALGAEGYQRERIPLQPLLALVAEVDDLRDRGTP